MWLFTQDGFFSLVQDRNEPKNLLVRARVKGDIERYWPDATVKMTPNADYLFRASISKASVAKVMQKAILDIDYDNYKDNISDHDRSVWYFRVWEAMSELQSFKAFDGPHLVY